MSVPVLNAAQTTDSYTEANTVVFSYPKVSFSLNVSGQAILYQLLIPSPTGQGYTIDSVEKRLLPSLSSFQSPEAEGFPGASGFAGVRVRSATAGKPATVDIA